MRGFLLSHLLDEAARRFPNRRAVVAAAHSLTYAELDLQAHRLAGVLREMGVRPGDRVGLFLDKSAAALVGIYGVLRAGAAYVPVDPSAPPPRAGYILRDCQVRCLLTAVKKAPLWPQLLAAGAPLEQFIVLDGPAPGDAMPGGAVIVGADALPATVPGVPTAAISQDLAYILYTSGSTGQPKGVTLSHLNALTFVRWCQDYFTPTPEDVFSQHAPLHFDLSILDIFLAAAAGATLVLVPHEVSMFPVQLAEFIERHGITIWYSVPSVLTLLVQRGALAPGRLSTLRHVIFAGEVFPTRYLRALMRLLPGAHFTNLYGPTETNVCTYYRVPFLDDNATAPIPIGRAIDDVEVFAVTEAGRRAELGEEGELYVRGSTVAYGYWGDPERTARAFVSNPLGPAGDRVYRTGDLVRPTPDGDYLFVGRRDNQIKSRGYRIELGDIEAALYADPDVLECAVIPIPDEVVGNRIRAFIVSRRPEDESERLRRACARTLPAYMIPETFEFLDALPKTGTGKIDRKALAARVPARPQG